jgi:phospholipid-binding lipoprotein MlaA
MFKKSLITTSILMAFALSLSGCGTAQPEPPLPTIRAFTDAAAKDSADKEFAIYDPAEGLNKNIYKFNAEFDDYIFLPVVNAYTFVTPKFVRTGVTNFFLNVGEINNFTNSVLQASPKKASLTLARFAVNTTVGLLGTFDVATHMGLDRQQEDFGKTLGHWGADSGAYVMLPVLGPSNVRDTVGKAVDFATLAFITPTDVRNSPTYDVIAYGLRPIDLRYTNDFRYYASGSPFEYELVRYVYTQLRTTQIEKEKHDGPGVNP